MKHKRYEPGMAVRAAGNVLAVVLVVSVLLHAAAAVAVYNRPIGHVDPALLQQDREPVRVRRATVDRIIAPGRQESPAKGRGATATPEQAAVELLEQASLLTEAAPEPELELRPVEDEAPMLADAASLDIASFELPADMLAGLGDARPADLEVRPGPPAVDLPVALDDGRARATRLLQAGAGLGAPGSPLAGAGGRAVRSTPAGIDRPDPLKADAALREIPLQGPPIDFVDIALGGTTEIDVPEHLDNDFDYRVTRWQDYFQVEVVAKRSLRKLKTMPKDVVIIVDTSSSIPQAWVQEMVSGVKHGLMSLNDADRFNLVLFNEDIRLFSTNGAVPATQQNIAAAKDWLDQAKAVGFTDVNAALTGLLRRDIGQDRVYNLILISDGVPTRGVLDTRELINRITRDNDLAASIYCIGVGDPRRQNRELLDFLAYRNRGYCLFTQRREDVAPTILDLLSRIRFPLIKDLKLSVAGVDGAQVYPRDLPNVHQGEKFSLYGRFQQPGPFTVRIAGTSAGQDVDFTFTRDLAHAEVGLQPISTQWAFWKLHHLYSEIIRRGETQALLDQIRDLKQRYGLKTLY